MLTLRDLFQCVYEMKKQEMEEVKQKVTLEEQPGGETSTDAKEDGEPVYQVQK